MKRKAPSVAVMLCYGRQMTDRTRSPIRGKYVVLAVVAAALIAAVVYVATQPPLFTPSGGSEYILERINETEVNRSDDSVVALDDEHVATHAPAFHELLQEATREGVSTTKNRHIQTEIREYIKSITESWNLNVILQFQGSWIELYSVS